LKKVGFLRKVLPKAEFSNAFKKITARIPKPPEMIHALARRWLTTTASAL
jgi:hypothetical protein